MKKNEPKSKKNAGTRGRVEKDMPAADNYIPLQVTGMLKNP
jgi:hypothetical protein